MSPCGLCVVTVECHRPSRDKSQDLPFSGARRVPPSLNLALLLPSFPHPLEVTPLSLPQGQVGQPLSLLGLMGRYFVLVCSLLRSLGALLASWGSSSCVSCSPAATLLGMCAMLLVTLCFLCSPILPWCFFQVFLAVGFGCDTLFVYTDSASQRPAQHSNTCRRNTCRTERWNWLFDELAFVFCSQDVIVLATWRVALRAFLPGLWRSDVGNVPSSLTWRISDACSRGCS